VGVERTQRRVDVKAEVFPAPTDANLTEYIGRYVNNFMLMFQDEPKSYRFGGYKFLRIVFSIADVEKRVVLVYRDMFGESYNGNRLSQILLVNLLL
jgi:hypothetical protein